MSVAKGAVLGFGDGESKVSAPKLGNDLVVNGGKVCFHVDVYRNDQFTSVKNVVLDNAILSVNTINGKVLAEGDEITLFKDFVSISGTYTIESDGYLFDDSQFFTSGKLRVKGISTGIDGVTVDGSSAAQQKGTIEQQYDLQGRAYGKNAKVQGVRIVKQQVDGKTVVRKYGR